MHEIFHMESPITQMQRIISQCQPHLWVTSDVKQKLGTSSDQKSEIKDQIMTFYSQGNPSNGGQGGGGCDEEPERSNEADEDDKYESNLIGAINECSKKFNTW